MSPGSPRRPTTSASVLTYILAVLVLVLAASAQSTTNSSNASNSASTPAPASVTTSLSLTTSTLTSLSTTRSGNQNIVTTAVITTTFNATVTVPLPTSSTTTSATSTTSTTSSATPSSIKLDTKIDPAFGVLGALLIITGIPSAFLGHKNRWTSFFLIGFYTLALTCAVLVIRFGVLGAIHPPSQTVRGMFVLSSAVAGIIGGGISIFFWKGARYFIGAWGGFVVGLFIQCFRDGGLIGPIGYRYIMYIGCGVIGFTLCTIAKIHYYVVIVSTGLVGATAFMLGVDCFTTADLKEFYMWNLGFKSLFPKYASRDIRFPLTQEMEIELGLMAAIAIMGIAVQLRVLKILQRKLNEIQLEARRHDVNEEERAAMRMAEVDLERDQWEKEHPGIPTKHGRSESGLSSVMPLMKDVDAPRSPRTPDTEALDFHERQRKPSGLSEFALDGRRSQSPGAIPALDLGNDVERDLPASFLVESSAAGSSSGAGPSNAAALEEIRKKEALLSEIQEMRKSIQILRDDTGNMEAVERDRRISVASRLTNLDVGPPAPSHLRPPRSRDPRARVQSMELSNMGDTSSSSGAGESIERPTSAPLLSAAEWDQYVRERKLFQPPAGASAPIATTPAPVSPAVIDALAERRRREDAIERGVSPPSPQRPSHRRSQSVSSNAALLNAPRGGPAHQRRGSSGKMPVMILPPQRGADSKAQRSKSPGATARTFEELEARHKAKMAEMQMPLSAAERERADVEKARARWERSQAVEREAVTRRQAERAREQAEEAQRSGDAGGRRSTGQDRHSRSLSADRLTSLGPASGSHRRQSVMKVEDWQRYQSEEPPADRRRSRSPGPNASFAPEASRNQPRRGSGPIN